MKYRRINICFFILTTWTIMITGCSKSIYVQNDKLGISKYIIYKDSYKYIEKTKTTDFEISGKYYLTDTTIVFELKDKEKIPKEPVPFASIGAKNKFGERELNTPQNNINDIHAQQERDRSINCVIWHPAPCIPEGKLAR